MGEIEPKYFDPAYNDFILTPENAEDAETPGFDSAETTAAIQRRFPGKMEINIGGVNLVLMAAGNYTEAGTGLSLTELGPEKQRAIAAALRGL